MKENLNLLIIDDSADDAELISLYLEQGGFKPHWQRVDNARGLQKALSNQNWDSILCDIRMPQLKPEDALQMIQEVDDCIPVIAVSGAVQDSEILDLLKSGMRDFFHKDSLARLSLAIRREMMNCSYKRQLSINRELLRNCEDLLAEKER